MEIELLGKDIVVRRKGWPRFKEFLNGNNYSKILLVCDENTKRDCLPIFLENVKPTEIYTVPLSENCKTRKVASKFHDYLLENKYNRNSLLIALGGGALCDLVGYVACTFKRGIPLALLPTSLLAMVDASVGAKNGLNFKGIKNILGTFYVPEIVLINSEFLKSLEQREFSSGLAEVLKYASLHNPLINDLVKTNNIEDFIKKSVEVKSSFVRKDPYDHGIRKMLNFGHTLGHAMEATLQPQLLHGEAVAFGMRLERRIAIDKLLISEDFLFDWDQLVAKIFGNEFPKFNLNSAWSFMLNDKKNVSEKVTMSVPGEKGTFHQNIEITHEEIQRAINYFSV